MQFTSPLMLFFSLDKYEQIVDESNSSYSKAAFS